VQIGHCGRPVGDPGHLDPAEGGGQQPGVPAFGSAPYHLVGAGHLAAPPFRGGAGVKMILQRLAQHATACSGRTAICGSLNRVITVSNRAREAA
jgi:hypothetical protein